MSNKAIWFIAFLAAFLRLSTLPSFLIFTADESYLSYVAQTIIKDFHIIWIGWSALGFDLYLGPFWIYIISPFLYFSKGDPLILGLLSSFMGVGSVLLIYWIGKSIFNQRVGIISSLMYSSLPLIIYYDQKPYPPGVPFLSLVLFFLLFKAGKNKKWWIAFAAAYGMVFHIHLSLIPIIFVAIYWAWVHRKSINRRIALISTLVFLSTVSPLIAFDYFHKASNITAPFRALNNFQGRSGGEVISHLRALFISLGRVWYLNPNSQSGDEILPNCSLSDLSTFTTPPWIISTLSILILLIFIANKRTLIDKSMRLLLLFSLAFLVPFIFVTVINPVEYYLLGFFPLFFLITAVCIERLRQSYKLIAYLLTTAVILAGVNTISTAKSDFGLKTKHTLISKINSTINNQSFYLAAEGDCQKVGGWRYLFKVYGDTPTRSTDDKIFGWLYPDELTNENYKYSVIIYETRVMAPETQIKNNYSVIREGGFTAYITEHISSPEK